MTKLTVPKKLKKGSDFELDIKRCYMPGYEITDTCYCGAELHDDLGDNYLSYPTVNAPFEHTLYCNECDAEKEIKLLLTLNLELVK